MVECSSKLLCAIFQKGSCSGSVLNPIEDSKPRCFDPFVIGVQADNKRTFESGATRDTDLTKLDYEGFFSPIVMKIFAEYMDSNRHLKDGSTRESDNWQKGIPKEAYMKSGFRHFMDWWFEHRGYKSREGIDKALCGLIFNAMGYLYELHKTDSLNIPEKK